jgi:hypothetical protein
MAGSRAASTRTCACRDACVAHVATQDTGARPEGSGRARTTSVGTRCAWKRNQVTSDDSTIAEVADPGRNLYWEPVRNVARKLRLLLALLTVIR